MARFEFQRLHFARRFAALAALAYCSLRSRRAPRDAHTPRAARCALRAPHVLVCYEKKVPTASFLTFNGYILRHFCVFQPLLTPNMPAELCNLLICTLYNFHPNDCLLGSSGGLWRPLEVPTASFLTFNGYISRIFAFFSLY